MLEQDLEELLKDMDFSELQVSLHQDCVLCGMELKFRHKVDYKSFRVKEESYCQHCNVRSKVKDYFLQ